MPLDPNVRPLTALVDVVDRIDRIDRVQGYVDTRTESEIVADGLVREAVERRLIIIQEALSRLQSLRPDLHQRIGDTHRIRGFKNLVVHEHDEFEAPTVCGIIVRFLPVLREQVQELVEEPEHKLD